MPRIKSKPYDFGPTEPIAKPTAAKGEVSYLASIANATKEEREETRRHLIKENKAHLQEKEEETFERGEIKILSDPKRLFLSENESSDEDSSSSSSLHRPVGSDEEQSPIILDDHVPWPRHPEEMPGYTSDVDEDEIEIKVEATSVVSDDETENGMEIPGEVIAQSIEVEGEGIVGSGKRIISGASDESMNSIKTASAPDTIEVDSPYKPGAKISHFRKATLNAKDNKPLAGTRSRPVRASKKTGPPEGFEEFGPTAASRRPRTVAKKRALSPDEMFPDAFYGHSTKVPKRAKGSEDIPDNNLPVTRKRAASTAQSHASVEHEFVPTATSNRPTRTGVARKVSNYSMSSSTSPAAQKKAVKIPGKIGRPRGRPPKAKRNVDSDENNDMFPNLTKKQDVQSSFRNTSGNHGLGGDGAGEEEDVHIRGGSTEPGSMAVSVKKPQVAAAVRSTDSEQSQSPGDTPTQTPSPPKKSRAERLETRARLASTPQDFSSKERPSYSVAASESPSPNKRRGVLNGSCRNCRARHRKCEREKPICRYCKMRGDNCVYP